MTAARARYPSRPDAARVYLKVNVAWFCVIFLKVVVKWILPSAVVSCSDEVVSIAWIFT